MTTETEYLAWVTPQITRRMIEGNAADASYSEMCRTLSSVAYLIDTAIRLRDAGRLMLQPPANRGAWLYPLAG